MDLIWLTGRLMPDHKTIGEFRRLNRKAVRRVCAEFVGICRELKLFEQVIVAIDGSKFKAVNSPRQELHQEEYQASHEASSGTH